MIVTIVVTFVSLPMGAKLPGLQEKKECPSCLQSRPLTHSASDPQRVVERAEKQEMGTQPRLAST